MHSVTLSNPFMKKYLFMIPMPAAREKVSTRQQTGLLNFAGKINMCLNVIFRNIFQALIKKEKG